MNRGDYQIKHKRPEYDWFVDPYRATEQLLDAIDFGADLIWDPACGQGNILDVAEAWGHPTFGSDIIDRKPRHFFQRGNILTQIAKMPSQPGLATSIICNPPFSYEDDIGERIILHCLDTYPIRRAAFILPISFLAGQNRWQRMIFEPRSPRPSQVLYYTERHSMPPGHLQHQMKAEGGTMDYIVLAYLHPFNQRTESVWLRPGPRVPRQQAATKEKRNAA